MNRTLYRIASHASCYLLTTTVVITLYRALVLAEVKEENSKELVPSHSFDQTTITFSLLAMESESNGKGVIMLQRLIVNNSAATISTLWTDSCAEISEQKDHGPFISSRGFGSGCQKTFPRWLEVLPGQKWSDEIEYKLFKPLPVKDLMLSTVEQFEVGGAVVTKSSKLRFLVEGNKIKVVSSR